MNNINLIFYFFLATYLTFSLTGCMPEDEIVKETGFELAFSTDTLRFDTVFTQLGSATRILKVYNRQDERIRISNIEIEGDFSQKFRMNVDGIPGNRVEDVEIPANDSIYIFCEVEIDPDEDVSASPFVIESQIRFETDDREQRVLLEAWGQNANYVPSRFGKGTLNLLNGDAIWDDPKPYVIYGWLFVDNGTLTIPAGTRIYIHGGLVRNEELGVYNDGRLWILENGRLDVQGTAENPVIIEGDRLEEAFEEEANQWRGIFFASGSRGNRMSYATIRNSSWSIYVDSAATFVAEQSQFYNTGTSSIIGEHATITMDNCLIYNNGGNSFQVIHGGDYELNHCTVASYGVDASALALSNFICYVPASLGCELGGAYRLNARFRNSIFSGSKNNEVIFVDVIENGKDGFDYTFENCIVKVDEDFLEENPDFYENCLNCPQDITRDTPLFMDVNEDDYTLDSLSVAIDAGVFLDNVPVDLEGKRRDQSPDIGCFEKL
ncbi:MAG: right-handed parallel beta-helix repeat-containing protein [Bacteroidota bacterium]